MLKITFTLFVLAFGGLTAHSQDYQISLQDQTLNLPGQPYFISRVIDGRLDQSNVGMAQTGVFNSRKMAVLARPLAQELTAFFNRSLPPSTGKQAIMIKVLEFWVREETRNYSEKNTAEVALLFLYQPEPGKYFALCELSSVYESQGLGVTGKHAKNLAAALQDCLLQFSELSFDELCSQATPLSPEDLEKRVAEPEDMPDYAILRDTVIHSGAYRSFREFRDNAPGITQTLSITRVPHTSKSWKGTDDITLYTLEPNGQKKQLRDVWGFSDGQETYIYHEGDYYLLERLGNGFAFYGRDKVLNSGRNGLVVQTFSGVTGGTVGMMPMGSYDSYSQPPNSKVKYLLELTNGKVTDQQRYRYKQETESQGSANLVIYYYDPKSAPEANLPLSLTDQLTSVSRELRVNSKMELIWPDVRDSLLAQVGNSAENRLTFLPKGKSTVYLSCRPRTKNPGEGVEIRIVEKMEADFYLNKIRSLQEKEEKRRRK
jgi:hypothetical protein